jgi:hypothetical protein
MKMLTDEQKQHMDQWNEHVEKLKTDLMKPHGFTHHVDNLDDYNQGFFKFKPGQEIMVEIPLWSNTNEPSSFLHIVIRKTTWNLQYHDHPTTRVLFDGVIDMNQTQFMDQLIDALRLY